MNTSRRPNAPLITGLGALIAIALALPLLAPSCSDFQGTSKVFARGSLIIPMDVCYQYQTDGVRASYTPSSNCPGAVTENGDVIKAYGLVYQLIRNGVAVYWIIDPAKAALTTPDLTIQYNPGFPVLKYDWSGASPSVAPNTSSHTIKYLGGPFVVDGADAARAAAVFQKYKSTFRPTVTTGVNVHVSNIAFTAPVAKLLAGGWNAGGAVPPKLALLNIGSSDAANTSGSRKNSEVVIRGYLQKAGLDISEPDPANPTVLLAAGGSATGTHGTIYDRLDMVDFQPDASGDWRTSNLYKNGYQILWVPHWMAPGSCSDCPPSTSCTCTSKYATTNPTYISNALKTIGAFGAAGKDVFAECAGLGSFEGVTGNASYGTSDATTHFQTVVPATLVGALAINKSVSSTPVYRGFFASPLMQLGDYPFIPLTGAIQNYKPGATTPYRTGGADATVQLISETNDPTYDIFTHRPGLSGGHGTFVYLGGHDYSGADGSFEVGGTRLVLNTLFNLGAGCTEGGVTCDTGKPGRCARGVYKCVLGATQCVQVDGPVPETCNGIDDDCNGVVDDGLDQACYDGPKGTDGVGLCHGGVRSCVRAIDGSSGFTACTGQVTPATEVCNGLDDNCDGRVDEDPSQTLPPLPALDYPRLARPCYDGDPSTVDPATGIPLGACKPGISTCDAGSWGRCEVCTATQIGTGSPPPTCQILPRADPCNCPECGSGTAQDWDCNGRTDQCGCTPGTTQPCYSGPAGSLNVGICRAGTQTCDASLKWTACVGEVVPQTEICQNGIDENCNGLLDDGPPACGECTNGDTRPCYTGPDGTENVGACKGGTQLCVNRSWAACGTGTPQTLPGNETCNGKDDNCDGLIDVGAKCGPGFECVNGVCVYASCGPEVVCAEGYWCNPATVTCQLFNCGPETCSTAGVACANGATCASLPGGGLACQCPLGATCSNGACVDPNTGLHCGPGSAPAGGFCTGGACYEAGCPDGTHCLDGTACKQGDLCLDNGKPCPSAQLCLSGTCQPDPCAGVLCRAGTFCRAGDCVQTCAFLDCGPGKQCDLDGFCVVDRCASVTCSSAQTCLDGTCVNDLCATISCGRGQACLDGVCSDDPCAGIVCPAGQCQSGQCYATGSNAGTPAARETTGCGCTTGGPGTPLALLALLALAPLARRRRRAGPGAALLGLLLLTTVASGCKKEAPFDPATCTAPGVNLATCPGEDRCVDPVLDPSHCGACGHACLAGETCVDRICGPASSVAPAIGAVTPQPLTRGLLEPTTVSFTGQRFLAGASVRATRSAGTTTYAANVLDDAHLTAPIDLRDAPAEAWSFRVVNPDRVISNKLEVQVVVPTPALTSLSPPSAAIGGVIKVTLVGTGLMVDSLCFFGGGNLLEQVVPSVLKAGGLECELDLALVPPGSFKLWVVNLTSGTPLSSNKLDFLTTSNSAVRLDSLAPSSGRINSITSLSAFGAGFDSTSQVVFVASIPLAAPVEVVQATAFRSTNELYVAVLDLAGYPLSASPGPAYSVKVRSGTVDSAPLPYAIVNTSPPSISSLSPASAFQGETKSIVVTGLSLPTTGVVLEYRPPGGTFVSATGNSSTTTTATGTVDLIGTPPGSRPAGTYDIRLRIGTTFTGSLPFTVISNTAILQSIAPASGLQGLSVPVTFKVPNLRPGAVSVRFSGSGTDIPASAVNATAVSATVNLAGLATGSYTLQVVNPNGAAPSNPANFTVRPGMPTLASVSPTSAPIQDAPLTVQLAGSNFARPDLSGFNGSKVYIFANCTPVRVGTGPVTDCTCSGGVCVPLTELKPPGFVISSITPTQLTATFDTRTAVPLTYSVFIRNPPGVTDFQDSNILSSAFTLTAP